MQNRRNFIQHFSLAGAWLAMHPFARKNNRLNTVIERIQAYNKSIEESITDEDFWHLVKQAYTVSPTLLNLNNGGVSPQPKRVQEALEYYNRYCNEAPSYYMWRYLEKNRPQVIEQLSLLAGCSPDEIVIQRNTTEALSTVVFGLPLEKGDEVVLTKQDYPNMINAWKQREMRDGIVLKWLNFDFPMEDKNAIVRAFADAFTKKTKLVHITHMINWVGQILPVREIAQEARRHGIEVLVDGAHTFAHLDFKIPDLECDYFGTSLHKWLCAPFGSGMLYVKKDKIKKLYPLHGAPDLLSDDISKFQHMGTRSVPTELAIGHAIEFHNMIGIERKQKRLHYLKNYWAEKLMRIPGVRIHTSLKPEYGCAIGLFSIEGKELAKIAHHLQYKHKIHITTIDWENIYGIRITPNVYTLTSDLDRLVRAIEDMLRTQ